MLTQRDVTHKTARGRIFRQVTEHYLRDDIYCGISNCSDCKNDHKDFPDVHAQSIYKEDITPFSIVQSAMSEAAHHHTTQTSKASKAKSTGTTLPDIIDQTTASQLNVFLQSYPSDTSIVLVPDSTIYLQQMDLLESHTAPFSNIVMLQSIFNYMSQKHYKTYQRMRALSMVKTFESATTLKSNFVSQSYSAANTSQDDTILPSVHVFSDFHHQEVYSQAMDLIQDFEEDVYLPMTKTNNIPSSLVQYVTLTSSAEHLSVEANAQKTLDYETRCINELTICSQKWYARHNRTICPIILTNDVNVAQSNLRLGALTLTMEQYIHCFLKYHPGLESILAACVRDQQTRDTSQWVYKDHLALSQLQSGVANGILFSGKMTVDRDYWTQASVTTSEFGRVLIPGFQSMNRAIDGDLVVIQVWPKSEWVIPSQKLAPDVVPAHHTKSTEGGTQTSGDDDSNMSIESLVKIDTIDEVLDDNSKLLVNLDDDYIPSHPITREKEDMENDLSLAVPTGEVVGILDQSIRTFCGSLEETDKREGSIFFIPVNRRIPKVRIQSKNIAALSSQRIMVRIDEWPITSKHPIGHLVRVLGEIGDNTAETEVVLIEHEIRHDAWSAAVEACLPPPDYEISPEEMVGRTDLRHINVCSIDPPGCVDIDDALHCVELENGNYEVGVHIADVTHYVRPGSALDIEASTRATSVYLVDRRIDMIPARLSTNLCSLHERVDRLAFSTVWELSPKAEIVNVKFFKSIIHSKAAFSYAQAQKRIDSVIDESVDKTSLDYQLTMACKNLMMLAHKIKQRRIDNGALTLASSEVKFSLNDDRTEAQDVSIYQLKPANSLVEEFMLLANVSVAEHILTYFPTLALLRGHPNPPDEMLQPLVRAAKAWGFDVDISSGKALSDSLDAIQDPKNPLFNKVMRMLTTRCMTQARYVCSGEVTRKQLVHFGLACNTYTHFTSPIRRYSDIIAHRLLATSLGIDPLPVAIQDRAHMRDVVENLNYRHRMAQLASRASTEVWTLKYFTGKDIICNALILAVRSTGLRVMAAEYGVECAVRLVPTKRSNEVITVTHTASSSGSSAGASGSTSSSGGAKDTDDSTANRANMMDYDMIPDNIKTHGFIYNPNNVTLTVYGVPFKILQQVQVRIRVKENKARRRWLSVELAGDLKKQLDPELLSQLFRDDDGVDVQSTPGEQVTVAPRPADDGLVEDTSASGKTTTTQHQQDQEPDVKHVAKKRRSSKKK